MFSSRCNHSKLKTNLRLAIARLKQIEKKKAELAQKSRKEIADYISAGKVERAKIRVEQIIREDYMVEGMEIVEMYCDLLISRFGLFAEEKELQPSLAEAVSSILWVAPRMESDIPELKVISEQIGIKVGKKYVEACRLEMVDTISDKLKHKMGVQPPPKILVEKYLIEIAKNYDIHYEPDQQVMLEEQQSKGIDALLFDNGLSNDLGGEKTRPTGFVGFPQPPLPPMPVPASAGAAKPFNYPSIPPPDANDAMLQNFLHEESKDEAPPPYHPSFSPPFSYNIPPSSSNVNLPPDPSKKINTASGNNLSNNGSSSSNPDMNINKQNAVAPKPTPRSKMAPPGNSGMDLNLPSVPSDEFPAELPPNANAPNNDDIDFDDLMKRFEDLKKRK
ncbi:IST1 homolog isoform X2 [Bemisia tabaci]|uniref:IST1 homolog isoform X2 n=1 Tax=Bemisia tabaci TaxID=7038 RepID=UPI0008F98B34|nr:PREDICTED: IST1 homolog isoform X2 [Bemisia tabaci]